MRRSKHSSAFMFSLPKRRYQTLVQSLAKACSYAYFHGHFGHGIKSLLLHGTTITVLKSKHCAQLSLALLSLYQPEGDRVSNDLFGLIGPWARIILYISWSNCKLMNPEYRSVVCRNGQNYHNGLPERT